MRGRAVVAIFMLLLLAQPAFLAAGEDLTGGKAPAAPERWNETRPDAATIRAELARLLEDPEFAPRKTLLQWLMAKLSALKFPKFNTRNRLLEWFWWGVVIWCGASLVFLVGHMVWTVGIAIRSRSGTAGRGRAGQRAGSAAPATFAELRAEMGRLAQAKAYRGAVAAMMAALLRFLERSGTVSVHPGKTNGDYVREFAGPEAGREAFSAFSRAFDRVIYSGARCDRAVFERMESQFDRVLSHAQNEP